MGEYKLHTTTPALNTWIEKHIDLRLDFVTYFKVINS